MKGNRHHEQAARERSCPMVPCFPKNSEALGIGSGRTGQVFRPTKVPLRRDSPATPPSGARTENFLWARNRDASWTETPERGTHGRICSEMQISIEKRDDPCWLGFDRRSVWTTGGPKRGHRSETLSRASACGALRARRARQCVRCPQL